MNPRNALKHALKILAGLPPAGPTDAQLDAIIAEVVRVGRGRIPTQSDWLDAARRLVPDAGKYAYAGEDMSNLNQLLLMIQQTSQRPGTGGGSGTTKK